MNKPHTISANTFSFDFNIGGATTITATGVEPTFAQVKAAVTSGLVAAGIIATIKPVSE